MPLYIYVLYTCYSRQKRVWEIDFRLWYNSSDDLKDDEERDVYPPRFITTCNRHSPLCALDVQYMLLVVQKNEVIKTYTFNIYVGTLSKCRWFR